MGLQEELSHTDRTVWYPTALIPCYYIRQGYTVFTFVCLCVCLCVCEHSIPLVWMGGMTYCSPRNVFDSCVKSWHYFRTDKILLETSFYWLSDDIVRSSVILLCFGFQLTERTLFQLDDSCPGTHAPLFDVLIRSLWLPPYQMHYNAGRFHGSRRKASDWSLSVCPSVCSSHFYQSHCNVVNWLTPLLMRSIGWVMS